MAQPTRAVSLLHAVITSDHRKVEEILSLQSYLTAEHLQVLCEEAIYNDDAEILQKLIQFDKTAITATLLVYAAFHGRKTLSVLLPYLDDVDSETPWKTLHEIYMNPENFLMNPCPHLVAPKQPKSCRRRGFLIIIVITIIRVFGKQELVRNELMCNYLCNYHHDEIMIRKWRFNAEFMVAFASNPHLQRMPEMLNLVKHSNCAGLVWNWPGFDQEPVFAPNSLRQQWWKCREYLSSSVVTVVEEKEVTNNLSLPTDVVRELYYSCLPLRLTCRDLKEQPKGWLMKWLDKELPSWQGLPELALYHAVISNNFLHVDALLSVHDKEWLCHWSREDRNALIEAAIVQDNEKITARLSSVLTAAGVVKLLFISPGCTTSRNKSYYKLSAPFYHEHHIICLRTQQPEILAQDREVLSHMLTEDDTLLQEFADINTRELAVLVGVPLHLWTARIQTIFMMQIGNYNVVWMWMFMSNKDSDNRILAFHAEPSTTLAPITKCWLRNYCPEFLPE